MNQPQAVAKTFDQIADVFDSQLENEITARLRKRIYRTVEALLPRGGTLLDINSGTGIDAAYFVSRGFHVTGIDISPEMVRVAQKKIGHEGATFKVGSFENLATIIDESFDVAFSNFGGLNCVNRLDSAARAIAHGLRKDGYLVAAVMPSFSLWEFFSFAFRGELSMSLRRMKGRTRASGFPGNGFDVFYYSPATLSKAFGEWFRTIEIYGLSIVSPTPQSVGFVRRFPVLTEFLEKANEFIEAVPFVRAAGDHYVVTMQKR